MRFVTFDWTARTGIDGTERGGKHAGNEWPIRRNPPDTRSLAGVPIPLYRALRIGPATDVTA